MECGTWSVGHGEWDMKSGDMECETWSAGHGVWDMESGT